MRRNFPVDPKDGSEGMPVVTGYYAPRIAALHHRMDQRAA
jgi:hypothetical protein